VIIKIKDTYIKADGFDANTNTIYEFYGDYWHGNLNIYNSCDINKHNKQTFGLLYFKIISRELMIKKAGYNLITIWENDYRKKK
jgi:hypothetical protein